jgi:hypothetical protein
MRPAHTLDGLNQLNEMAYRTVGDPETHTRIQQYEMAFRMQSSVPELTDLSKEPRAPLNSTARKRRSPAASPTACSWRAAHRARRALRADLSQQLGPPLERQRRMPEPVQGRRPAVHGLIQDLKQRGLFDSTLIIWGGEFGRTIYSQGGLTTRTTGAITTRAASRCGWPAAA